MSICDSLGFLAPYTIQSRIIMQEIWISGIKWDKKLKGDEFNSWKYWITNLNKVREYRFPRLYFRNYLLETYISLHIFCDAILLTG